jgi:hypothetical protein
VKKQHSKLPCDEIVPPRTAEAPREPFAASRLRQAVTSDAESPLVAKARLVTLSACFVVAPEIISLITRGATSRIAHSLIAVSKHACTCLSGLPVNSRLKRPNIRPSMFTGPGENPARWRAPSSPRCSDGQDAADAFVFPRGGKRGQPLSNTAFLVLLRRMKHDDLTVHGFRSTFHDWTAERTNFPSEVAEMALAHTVSSKVEQAYRRGDLLERRRRMMTLVGDVLRNGEARCPEQHRRVRASRLGLHIGFHPSA